MQLPHSGRSGNPDKSENSRMVKAKSGRKQKVREELGIFVVRKNTNCQQLLT